MTSRPGRFSAEADAGRETDPVSRTERQRCEKRLAARVLEVYVVGLATEAPGMTSSVTGAPS